MVSVIIPVYNAERYLNRCMESILNQTYAEIEIICVDDGATDDSYNILMEYGKNDSRVKVLQQSNMGQGMARNKALVHATGEYVMYVDSDDWLEEDCIEKLLEAAKVNKAEVVIGKIAKTKLDSEEIDQILKECDEKFIDKTNKRDSLFRLTTYPVARLIKRTLLVENNVKFSNHYFEDVALFPLIYALASRIALIDDVVYYYRSNSGSTVNNLQHVYDRIVCLETLARNFKERDLYKSYEEEILDYIKERMQVNLRCAKNLCNRFYINFQKEQNEFVALHFNLKEWKRPKVYCYGSYNLMIIAKIFMGYEDSAIVENYYGGQGIISCMSQGRGKLLDVKVTHRNSFRKACLLQDFEKRFANLNPGEFEDVDYVFIDLLEERYDIGRCETAECFTLSEYFWDSESMIDLEYETIPAFSEEWFKLWEKASLNFVERIKKYVPEEKIVLVRMQLSKEYYSDEGCFLYENHEEISAVNECLNFCYDTLQEYAPQMTIIDVTQMESFKTNRMFRHGCYPWHLNDKFYLEASRFIEMQLYKNIEVKQIGDNT